VTQSKPHTVAEPFVRHSNPKSFLMPELLDAVLWLRPEDCSVSSPFEKSIATAELLDFHF
jgi:hypothetical protein